MSPTLEENIERYGISDPIKLKQEWVMEDIANTSKFDNFYFKAPDWKNEKNYNHLDPKTTCEEEWAWEFRRRNPFYWQDVKTSFEAKGFLIEQGVTKKQIDAAVKEKSKEIKRQGEIFNKQIEAQAENRSLCSTYNWEIAHAYQSIETLQNRWCVEEKSPHPGYLRILPNPNTDFKDIKILQGVKPLNILKPKVINTIDNKPTYPDKKIYLEVSVLNSFTSNIEDIKGLLKEELAKYEDYKNTIFKEHPRLKQTLQPKSYKGYLRLLDGLTKKVKQYELCEKIYPKLREGLEAKYIEGDLEDWQDYIKSSKNKLSLDEKKQIIRKDNQNFEADLECYVKEELENYITNNIRAAKLLTGDSPNIAFLRE